MKMIKTKIFMTAVLLASLAQAKAYFSALWQGDPEGMRTLKAVMREYWASFTAGRSEKTTA